MAMTGVVSMLVALFPKGSGSGSAHNAHKAHRTEDTLVAPSTPHATIVIYHFGPSEAEKLDTNERLRRVHAWAKAS